jgi:hypothetical protein
MASSTWGRPVRAVLYLVLVAAPIVHARQSPQGRPLDPFQPRWPRAVPWAPPAFPRPVVEHATLPRVQSSHGRPGSSRREPGGCSSGIHRQRIHSGAAPQKVDPISVGYPAEGWTESSSTDSTATFTSGDAELTVTRTSAAESWVVTGGQKKCRFVVLGVPRRRYVCHEFHDAGRWATPTPWQPWPTKSVTN